MKLARILSNLYRSPWAVLPEVHQQIQNIVLNKVDGNFGDFSMPDDLPPVYDRVGDVAIININGVILPKASALERLCGAVSCVDIRKAVKQAGSSDASTVILNIDSPGGVASGVPETADAIAALAKIKDVMAFSNGDMCSAAYWLGSQASNIVVSPSSSIGSIGVFVAVLTMADALKMQGLKAEIIQAGTLKTLGMAEKDMTDDERAYLTDGVNKCYLEFTGAVLSTRDVAPETMQGQVFDGRDAINNGLADGLQDDLDDFITFLNN